MRTASPDAAVDKLQHTIAGYAASIRFEDLSDADRYAVKVRIIDTLGGLLGAFPSDQCQLVRKLAADVKPGNRGATILGTRDVTSLDMAAFVNGTTARFLETNDVYFPLAYSGTHPSDVIMPVLAAAEDAHSSGPEFLVQVALAYEICIRVADATTAPGYDQTNFTCMGVAMGAGRALGLPMSKLLHCLSMAIVPNNALYQTRRGRLSMWKAAAAGQAGRSGVFAAMLADAGVEGPQSPFEGDAGWCEYVARNHFEIPALGGVDGAPFKVGASLLKLRAACAQAISSILAAEDVVRSLGRAQINDIKSVRVETFESAKRISGTGAHYWSPTDRETADHSIPYVVAATLMDGTVGPRQFDDAHLRDPRLHALIQKVEVVELDEFTKAAKAHPARQLTRVVVRRSDGTEVVGRSGGEFGDINNPMTEKEVEEKFHTTAGEYLASERARHILDVVWNIEKLSDVSVIPSMLVGKHNERIS